MKIGNFEINKGRTFIIAEIGNNHNGSIDMAKRLVDQAIAAGADCAKFQMRHIEKVYRERSLKREGEDLGTEYVLDLLDRFELTVDEHRELASYCKTKGILYLCTPWDEKSLDVLEEIGVPAYKISSADLTNMPLIERVASKYKPLIISTGMSTEFEIKETVRFLNSKSATFALLHCNSTYPAPVHDINLKFLSALRNMHKIVGYSGHERGIYVSLAAVALGACIIERHFTSDRTLEGPDHAASLTQSEFADLVKGIRDIEQALGSKTERQVSQGEMINRENLGKSLIAATDLVKGTILKEKHISVRSPGRGLSPQKAHELIGRVLARDMSKEDYFYTSDISDAQVKPRKYKFSRPWGVPVRFHDFREYDDICKPDVFEFHLSYGDMLLNPEDFLKVCNESGFAVHSPELFANSRLLDLATDDEYRMSSIKDTQRVIDLTRMLKAYFPKTSKPLIVINIGGFTMDHPLPPDQIESYYERFGESLNFLDTAGVELIPQTMAPFPWHFGGQRYQNIFVKIDEIIDWCEKFNLRMCLDVSHSRLTCTHLEEDFYEFCARIAPYTAHIHLGDAKGVNGEGLQIGEGEIDFAKLGRILRLGCPESSFIPEIWQGHKNQGEGFWIALERLEGLI